MSADQPHWLLDLEIGGAVYRLADDDLDVDEGDTTFRYLGGLDALAVTIGEGGPTVAITVAQDVAAAVDRGVDLGAGRATLRRWYEGTDRASAEVIALGRVLEPEYGDATEPLTFSIDSSRWTSTETVPPRTARIDETTWPVSTVSGTPLEPDPSALGASYVRVYGFPGRDAARLWGTLSITSPAVPAYVAEFGAGAHTGSSSALIVADGVIGATSLRVTDVSGGYDARGGLVESILDVTTMQDLRGRTVSVCVIGYDADVHIIPGNEYWTTWETTGGGGVLGVDGLPIRALGAVIEDLLQQAGVAYDRGRMAASRSRLDRFAIDCFIAGARPEDWIDDNVADLLPILRREGPSGVWWELWRYDATDADVELHLVVDDDDPEDDDGIVVEVASSIRWSDARTCRNDITLRYLATRDGYAKTRRLHGVEQPDASLGEYGSYLCAVSRGRYEDLVEEVETDIIAEDSTADLVLQWRAMANALPRRGFVVEGGDERLARLRPNSIVSFSRRRVNLSRALAIVREVTIGLDRHGIALELIDRPNRRGRA